MGYGGDSSPKNKLTVIVVSSIVLVGLIGAVGYGTLRNKDHHQSPSDNGGNTQQVTSSSKSIQSVCAPTQYKETCEKSLASANSTDPKELVKIALEFAQNNLGDAIAKSSLIEEASKDPRTKGALQVCKVVLNEAVEDFKKSSIKITEFDVTGLQRFTSDLRTWLSATVTYQETCIDAFRNTTGDAAEKMKTLLQTSSELASNAVAMVSTFSDVVSQLSFSTSSRRLFEVPSFVDDEARRMLFGEGTTLTPNAMVSAAGDGQFKTISEAVATIPKDNTETFIIFVKEGVYNENVMISNNKVVLIGEGPTKTKITGSKSYADGLAVYETATVAVDGDYFFARDIGFENSAGAEMGEAVALRVSGDSAVLFNCQMDGFRGTLYALTYRQFYRDCTITGTVDFVFGDAAAIFQNCKFIVRTPMENQNCIVTAQQRNDTQGVGAFVLQKCQIFPEPAYVAAKLETKNYLGRPAKEFSRTIIMNTEIDGFIDPEGWAQWMGTFALDTLYYGEFSNTGPGANTAGRVQWKGIQNITPEIAETFTPAKLFTDDAFITTSKIPYAPGMMA